jgi:glycosyltransferase involved in cell wall biosynthesis
MQSFAPTRSPVSGNESESLDVARPAERAPDPPQRILYVVSLFPCWSETFIVREIHALLEQGIDIRILSLKPPTQPMVHPQAAALLDRVLHPNTGPRAALATAARALRRPGLLLWMIAAVVAGLWRHPLAIAKSIVALWRALGRSDEIRDFDPQLIHAPWATYPATVAWFLSKRFGKPFSFTSRAHDIFLEDHMMARKLQQAALAVTITEHNVRYMQRWMPATGARPVRVIHSSLNLPELPYVRDGREPRKLLAVGRLDPIKGFDVLLDALALLRDDGFAFRCTVIGEGPLRARLERQRAELALEDLVEFVGAMPHDSVKRHMSDATLMVMPCVVTPEGNSDGIPNVLMEAMATGLPVVSTRVSGIPELVEDGVSGRLVAPGDAAALACAVAALFDDPALRERFAVAGRRKVERDFDVRIEAGRLLRHFGTACHA